MDEYSLHPVEYTCLDSWEPDLVLDASEQSSEDQSSDSDSDSDSSSDEELLWADQQADARLDEGDRLEDAIYEQKLWESINIDAQGHVLSDQDESSSSNNMSEDDLLASSEEDAEMGGGRSGTESEEDGEAAIAPEDERPSKRMRMFSDASGQGSIATGFRDDRKRRKSYRTKEFISTSDEEEDA